MYIVANFEHTIKLEMAITAVEMKGVPKYDILAVPLDKRNEDRMLFDRSHSSDSLSMLDLPLIMGTVFSLLGLIYGFLLHWGPIIWALIGTAFGIGLGIIIKLFTTRKRKEKQLAETPEVVLLIACNDTQAQMVQDTLWAYSSLGVAKLDLS
jgi:Flp pilus assembly protein TadB